MLLRVRASAVNPGDWAIMHGLPYIARPFPLYGLRKPKHPVRGTDAAGEVTVIGARVTRFRLGDEVFGWSRGAFAEYAAASEEAVAPKPANMSFEQAAAVPMSGTVALQALRDHGNVHTGQRILINGASGGIGSFAIQIGKLLGAEVTAVCSTGNLELVRSIGADHVIDCTKEDFTQNGQRSQPERSPPSSIEATRSPTPLRPSTMSARGTREGRSPSSCDRGGSTGNLTGADETAVMKDERTNLRP